MSVIFNPLYLHVETSGFNPKTDRIVRLVAFEPKELRVFSATINPECPIKEEAFNLHGISDEDVKDAPVFLDIAAKFFEFCPNNVIFVAHGASLIAEKFIKAEFNHLKIEFPDIQFIDSLLYSKYLHPEYPNHHLEYLKYVYKIPDLELGPISKIAVLTSQVFEKQSQGTSLSEIYLKLKTKKKK